MSVEDGRIDDPDIQPLVKRRTLNELINLHPYMLGGDPGAPERVIYAQALGLGGENVVYPSKRSFRQ